MAAVNTRRQVVLHVRTLDYPSVQHALFGRLSDEYGATSYELRALTSATLSCAGCGWAFPGSYHNSLLGMYRSRPVVGISPAAVEFGDTGICPRCQGTEIILQYQCPRPTEVTKPSSGPTSTRQERASKLIVDHVERVVKDRPDLMTSVAFRELTSTDTLDFIVNADAWPSPDGHITFRAKRLNQVIVLVSLVGTIDPSRIRNLMPAGYLPELDRLLHESGLRPGELDAAHVVLGLDADGRTAVHLAYLPAQRDITFLTPWDLLSDQERNRGSKTS